MTWISLPRARMQGNLKKRQVSFFESWLAKVGCLGIYHDSVFLNRNQNTWRLCLFSSLMFINIRQFTSRLTQWKTLWACYSYIQHHTASYSYIHDNLDTGYHYYRAEPPKLSMTVAGFMSRSSVGCRKKIVMIPPMSVLLKEHPELKYHEALNEALNEACLSSFLEMWAGDVTIWSGKQLNQQVHIWCALVDSAQIWRVMAGPTAIKLWMSRLMLFVSACHSVSHVTPTIQEVASASPLLQPSRMYTYPVEPCGG